MQHVRLELVGRWPTRGAVDAVGQVGVWSHAQLPLNPQRRRRRTKQHDPAWRAGHEWGDQVDRESKARKKRGEGIPRQSPADEEQESRPRAALDSARAVPCLTEWPNATASAASPRRKSIDRSRTVGALNDNLKVYRSRTFESGTTQRAVLTTRLPCSSFSPHTRIETKRLRWANKESRKVRMRGIQQVVSFMWTTTDGTASLAVRTSATHSSGGS